MRDFQDVDGPIGEQCRHLEAASEPRDADDAIGSERGRSDDARRRHVRDDERGRCQLPTMLSIQARSTGLSLTSGVVFAP